MPTKITGSIDFELAPCKAEINLPHQIKAADIQLDAFNLQTEGLFSKRSTDQANSRFLVAMNR